MNARPDTAQAATDAQLPAEFRSAVQLAQAAVWDWQLSVDLFQVDEAWVRAFGVDVGAAPMPVREWQRRIHPDDLGAFNAATDSCQHGGDRFECEYRLLAAGHRWLWVMHRGRVVQRERDGSVARITGLLLDIDRRKSEEVARSDSESRLATALWGARAAFWQWHIPSNARTASPLWLAMTGYSRAQWDATPNPWFSNLHPEDREVVDRQLREHAQGERDSVEFEYRFKTASGEYRWMQDRGRAVEWDLSGRPVLVIGVTLDIDATKRAEANLASSEHMLETAAWGAGIGLWETNFVTDTTRWFNDWCDRHDIDPCNGGDHVARWDENLHPDEAPEATRRFNEHVAGKAEYYDAEYRIRTRAGSWRWVFERGRVVERDADGRAVRMLGVCMDLDESKVAERIANARNERVEEALQLTTAGVWDWDVENGITHNTDGYYRVFGVDPALGNANHMNWRQLFGIDPDQAIDQFRRRLQRVDPDAHVLETEYRFRHTDGSWHWALDRAFVVERAPDGATRRVLGLVVDITARKLREQALSAADQRFRAIARQLNCLIYEIDTQNGTSSGEGCERVIGYAAAELPGPDDWAALVHPDDKHLLQQWFDQPDAMVALQYRIRHKDGHYVTLLDSPCVVRDAAGRVVRIVGVAIDFSEQARAQEALRSSQELLQMVAAGTSDWLILVDDQRRVQFINRGIRSHSRESIVGQRLDEIAVPEDRPRILAALTQVLTTGESVDLQLASSGAPYGGRRFDSRIRAVHSAGGISGAVINITEITDRQAAQHLRETQARMFELLHEGVVVIDSDNTIRMANPAFERMFGFAPGTAVDTSIEDLIAQPVGARRERADLRLLGNGERGPTPTEFKGRRRDGSTFEAACVATLTHLDGATHRLAVITDVTERRSLEREILEIAGREQLRIGSDLHDGLGQDLTGVALMLRSVVAQLRKENSSARADVEDIISLVNGAIESTRAMARGLAPVGADRGGLIAGLQSMAVRGMERYGVRAHFNTSLKEPLTLDDGAATHLYRIAQEAFTNAIRHGRVTQVTIELATAEGTLTLSVQDNGRGFDERNASNGMGMKLMRYRAQMLGGDVTIVNNPGGGVIVRCACPHRAPRAGDAAPRGGFPLKD